jgi:hypothetical protein
VVAIAYDASNHAETNAHAEATKRGTADTRRESFGFVDRVQSLARCYALIS